MFNVDESKTLVYRKSGNIHHPIEWADIKSGDSILVLYHDMAGNLLEFMQFKAGSRSDGFMEVEHIAGSEVESIIHNPLKQD